MQVIVAVLPKGHESPRIFLFPGRSRHRYRSISSADPEADGRVSRRAQRLMFFLWPIQAFSSNQILWALHCGGISWSMGKAAKPSSSISKQAPQRLRFKILTQTDCGTHEHALQNERAIDTDFYRLENLACESNPVRVDI